MHTLRRRLIWNCVARLLPVVLLLLSTAAQANIVKGVSYIPVNELDIFLPGIRVPLGAGIPKVISTAIDARSLHTCALTVSGGVKCWGHAEFGQLGDGTRGDGTLRRLTPVDVVGLTSGVKAITVGGRHTCALTIAGGVKCWGDNTNGQLGDGTRGDLNNSRLTPVDVVGLSSGVKAVAAGGIHTCAITDSGGVMCWGHAGSGQVGDGTSGDANSDRIRPVNVVGLSSGVAKIAAGGGHTCAITNSGGVKCWGNNGFGEVGDGIADETDTLRLSPVDVVGLNSGVKAITTGGSHTCALTDSGAVKCWGDNSSGQIGDGTTGDGSHRRFTPVDVVGLSSGVIAIAAGGNQTCAVTDSGGAKCWGSNSYGEVGDGGNFDGARLVPVDVVGLSSGMKAIAAGFRHSCALTGSGAVKCWGLAIDGQVGDGTSGDADYLRLTPVDVLWP